MANETVITKLANGNVLVDVDGTPYALNPDSQCFKETDSVIIKDKSGSQIDQFKVDGVEKVVRADTTEVTISDVDTLFTELINFFFFKSVTGGGSGTGWSGQVEFRADLPIVVGTPAVGSIYLVEKPTTILFGAYKTYQSGLYIRDNNTGALSDWRKLNVKVKFTDGEFAIVSAGDQSKQAKFDLSLVTAGTTRTVLWQDKDGTMALLSDIPIDYSNIDTTTITTFSTTGIVHSNLVVNGLDNTKTYIAEAFIIWNHDATNSDAFFELRNFAVNTLSERLNIEPADSGGGGTGGSNQRIPNTFSAEVTPTAGSVQLDLFYGTNDSGDETTIFETKLHLREKKV